MNDDTSVTLFKKSGQIPVLRQTSLFDIDGLNRPVTLLSGIVLIDIGCYKPSPSATARSERGRNR